MVDFGRPGQWRGVVDSVSVSVSDHVEISGGARTWTEVTERVQRKAADFCGFCSRRALPAGERVDTQWRSMQAPSHPVPRPRSPPRRGR
jgi:hypothetical protein